MGILNHLWKNSSNKTHSLPLANTFGGFDLHLWRFIPHYSFGGGLIECLSKDRMSARILEIPKINSSNFTIIRTESNEISAFLSQKWHFFIFFMDSVKILETTTTNTNFSRLYPCHKYRPLYLHNNQLVSKIIYIMNRMHFSTWSVHDEMKLNEV